MLAVAIYIKDVDTLEYNRVDLFDDEKISVTSSIQNINDISKTFTDFSQTFTIPASKQNNKIFRHWYDNSNDSPFSTLVKSDAYIEIDTIPFRNGKIQLESANLEDGQAKDYSITFIGTLGNLKDKFNGLYLKDLTDTTYDFEYAASVVKNIVINNNDSGNIMFPLITSEDVWEYGSGYDISATGTPIRYNDLFPAIKLSAVLNMIANDSNILNLNFNGSFLSDARFTNAYLWLKNADEFIRKETLTKVNFTSISGDSTSYTGYTANLTTDKITNTTTLLTDGTYTFRNKRLTFYVTPSVSGIDFYFYYFKNGIQIFKSDLQTSSAGVSVTYGFVDGPTTPFGNNIGTNDVFEFYIGTFEAFSFTTQAVANSTYERAFSFPLQIFKTSYVNSASQTTPSYTLQINKYFPEIKIEDFFSGILKMFNLTCYSEDGINYIVDTLENYYLDGSDIDITKYVIQDKKGLNRVKTYKKINFDYEKSESIINVGFNSTNGIEYGSLHYSNNPPAEGEEYSIKLPFEDLNFSNLSGLLQVGYGLKTDLQKYIPKPVILYDYNASALTTVPQFYFNTNTSGGTSTPHTTYKAFGQETLISGETYGLNFPSQQSTLTNEIVNNGLYQNYYSNYFNNIYNFKARLVKVSAILPTSILTTLKLNDNVIIRDTKYLINTFTTDLTTGEVQFELLTDQRQ
jgi:hypothetical protein